MNSKRVETGQMTEVEDRVKTAHAQADNHSQATAVSISDRPSAIAIIIIVVVLAVLFTTAAYGKFHGG